METLTERQKNEKYSESHYLLFGEEPSLVYDKLDCNETADFLRKLGFADNSLTQARNRRSQYQAYKGYHDSDTHYCDFCGKALPGVEYDVLKDGRERCTDCSQTVIKKVSDFEMLFRDVKDGLCLKFGIDIPPQVKIKVVSQAKMAKLTGDSFVPTKYFDPRAVGCAVNKNGKYTMYFENGTPRASLIATTAHELTHIWQYSHWDWPSMETKYGKLFLAVAEGMAKWVEIQYLYLLNEITYADRILDNEIARHDVYGYGLRMYLKQYDISREIVLKGATPFSDLSEPISSELISSIVS